MFSCVGDCVFDPFAGSGTTLKVAKELRRHYIGYENYENYGAVISQRFGTRRILYEYPGYSAVLNLNIRWERGRLAWHDPATGRHILIFDDERSRSDRAEARVR